MSGSKIICAAKQEQRCNKKWPPCYSYEGLRLSYVLRKGNQNKKERDALGRATLGFKGRESNTRKKNGR